MGQLTHSDEGIAKNSNMLLFGGAAVFLLNLWYYGYPAFVRIRGDGPDELVEKVRTFLADFFSTPYYTLFFCLIFFGMYIWGHRKNKTSTYVPTPMVKVWLPLLVKLELHPEFEYTPTKNKNGRPVLEKKRERIDGQFCVGLGIFLVLISPLFVQIFGSPYTLIYVFGFFFYALSSGWGFAYIILGGDLIHSMSKGVEDADANNTLQESFLQNEVKVEHEYSVNLRTEYKYKGQIHHGWINVINPFRATQVLGTPGSGKSYAVINEFIRQHLRKHFCMYCYDFKFPDLSTIVYNHYRWNKDSFRKTYGIEPKFCVINFDDPRKSQRCNPVSSKFLNYVTDAVQSAEIFMINLNKTWAGKQGEFFVESAKTYFTSCLWFLRCYKSKKEGSVAGEYCTIPHALELAMASYMDVIPILTANRDIYPYMINFFNSWEAGAQDQLQGQVASTQIALARLASPDLYWAMSGNDFGLDLNNPEEPKILCVGNNPEKKDIYAAVLGLFNGRIVSIINKKNQHKISLIIDELPTIFFRGLDNLIATARSNKVATCLGFQDFSQLKRDYGDKDAAAIMNTIGNTFAGLVVGETAKSLSEQFGRNVQHRTSTSISDSGESVSISEQMDQLIPASKIATLSQGTFVGTLCDDFGKEMPEKRFHARIIIDSKVVKHEESRYQPLPTYYGFDTKEVALDLCKTVIDFLENPEYFVAPVLIKDNNLPSVADFQAMIAKGDRIDVQKTISMIFTPEFNGKKQTMMAELFFSLGKGFSKQTAIHEGNLLAFLSKVKNVSNVGQVRDALLAEVGNFENAVADWLSAEKKAKQVSGSSVTLIIKKFKADIGRFNGSSASDVKEYFSPIVRLYCKRISSIFSRYAAFKGKLQGIRDAQMKDKLYDNMNKIRSEVQDIIKDMLVDMYEHNYDMWDRRLKVLKLNEKEELKKLGVKVEE